MSTNRASIYTILSEANLSASLRNAAHFVLQYLGPTWPNAKLIHSHFDEYYLLFDILVQFAHLHRWNSSFSERFFSLRRVDGNRSYLSNVVIFKSLVELCALPYVGRKLESIHQTIVEKRILAEDQPGLIRLSPVEQLISKYYPIVKQCFQLINLIYFISYIFNNDHPHNVVQHTLFGKQFRFSLRNEPTLNGTSILVNHFTNLFDFLLKSATFLIHFTEYWNSNADLRRLLSRRSPRDVPPPQPFKISVPSSICPLCENVWFNPTVLATSGYVFCYACVAKHVQTFHKCPITQLPSSTKQLVRIMT